jgi:hypothetical protein
MNGAFERVAERDLIMYENSQMLEYRRRKEFTNK